MKVLRNINNNVVLCQDSVGREVIAFGKGIGFIRPPREIPLSMINRTFYNIKDIDFSALREIPTKILNVAIGVADLARSELDVELASSVVLTLADHINFALRRSGRISLELQIQEDIKFSYPKEMEFARRAIAMINEELDCSLPEEEAGVLALHILGAEITRPTSSLVDTSECVDKSISIIEREYGVSIDRGEFNCSRFMTHLGYLIARVTESRQISSANSEMFQSLSEAYPQAFACAQKISSVLEGELGETITEEEKMYLLLHVNRVIGREGAE